MRTEWFPQISEEMFLWYLAVNIEPWRFEQTFSYKIEALVITTLLRSTRYIYIHIKLMKHCSYFRKYELLNEMIVVVPGRNEAIFIHNLNTELFDYSSFFHGFLLKQMTSSENENVQIDLSEINSNRFWHKNVKKSNSLFWMSSE